jgi:hypothetical protein
MQMRARARAESSHAGTRINCHQILEIYCLFFGTRLALIAGIGAGCRRPPGYWSQRKDRQDEDRLPVVFGTGQVESGLVARLAGPGIAVRSVSRNRPLALAGGVDRRAADVTDSEPGLRVLPMTDSPRIQLAAGGAKTWPRGRVLAPTRYRHPGDVIRLIAAALALAAAAVIAALVPALLRPGSAAITGVGPATAAGRVLTGLVQVTIAAAALVLLVAALRYRRFRVLATVAGGFAAGAALMAGITYLAGPGGSAGLPAGLRQGSWLAGAGFPDPAVLAGLAAVAVAAAPWLSRPWRRAAWATLLLIGVARLITGGLLPMQLVLALAAGVTVGAGLLVAFGVPDRRMGPAGVAAALRAGGVPVSQVTGPLATAKGSRPFQATTGDGRALFVKVFGSDQRDADLLYRATAASGCAASATPGPQPRFSRPSSTRH